MDLQTILFEFALGFNDLPQGKDSNVIALNLYAYIREFAKKHEQKPDLLTQYQQAINNDQYEIAHIIKNQITDILKQKHELRKGHTN